MALGGIERSLLGLLNALDYDKYDVDLQLFSVEGELLPFIDGRCRVLPEMPACAAMIQPLAAAAKTQPAIALRRAAARLAVQTRYGRGDAANFALLAEYWHSCVKAMPKLKTHYDTVISFMWPHDFAARNTVADRKLAWIHTDYTGARMNFARDEKIWACFDKIVGVSEAVCQTFAAVYPRLAHKLTVVENILPEELVRAQAEEFDPPEYDKTKKIILSVGRVSHAKAFDLAAQSAKIMRDNGVDFHWYLVGYGPDEAFLKSEIERLDVGDVFVFLGKRANPYPYIKHCDVYAQPSRYEGKAVTVREAQMLQKPVLITAYETAAGQVENGVDGVICPQGVENVAQALTALLHDEALCARLRKACAARDYSNRSFLSAFEQLIVN